MPEAERNEIEPPGGTPPEGVRPEPTADRSMHRLELLVLVAFALFTFLPLAKALLRGVIFGGDWSEYALTANQYLTHQSSLYTYPTPVMPLVYVPVVLATHDPVVVGIFSAVLSGILLVGIYLVASRLFRILTASRWAGLLGGVLLATGPLFLDEMGWGGQAQYLDFVFGLLALSTLLPDVVVAGSARGAFFASGWLAAAALTESYAAAYFVLAAAFLLVFACGRRILVRRNLTLAVATLALPVAVLGVLARLNASTTASVSSSTALGHALALSVYPTLYLRLAFYSPALEVLYPLIVAAYLLTGSSRSYPHARFRRFTLALGVAWVPQLLLLTPWVDLDRAFYFLMVPLGAMVAEIAAVVPGMWERARAQDTGRPPPLPSPRFRLARSYAIPLVALVAVLTVGVQVGVSAHTYYGSLTYYSYPSGDLSELSFLQDKNGSLLLVAPTPNYFPAGFASGRNVFVGPPGQPAEFDRPSQVAAVETANVLALGSTWIRAGNAWVIDSEPAYGSAAPALLEYSGAYLLPTLALDDASSTVTVFPNGAPDAPQVLPLSTAPNITSRVGPASLTTTYDWSDLAVTKVVAMAPDGAVAVTTIIAPRNATLDTVNLTVAEPSPQPTVASTPPPNSLGSVTLTQTYHSGIIPTTFTDTVRANATDLAGNTTYRPGGSSILEEFHPTGSARGTYSATITLAPSVPTSVPGSTSTEGPTLAANDLNWVAVERGSGIAFLERFFNDPQFTLYATSPHYLVFETRWG